MGSSKTPEPKTVDCPSRHGPGYVTFYPDTPPGMHTHYCRACMMDFTPPEPETITINGKTVPMTDNIKGALDRLKEAFPFVLHDDIDTIRDAAK